MSLILAIPCREGIVLAGDSRGLVGGQPVETPSKITVVGAFGIGTSGCADPGRPDFDPAAFSLDWWREVGYAVEAESFVAFTSKLAEYVRSFALGSLTPNDLTGVLVTAAPTAARRLSGLVLVPFDTDAAVTTRFYDETLADALKIRPIGAVSECGDAIKGTIAERIAGIRAIGELDASAAAAFAMDVMLRASEQNLAVGGTVHLALIRPS
jgi:hypothetical protein